MMRNKTEIIAKLMSTLSDYSNVELKNLIDILRIARTRNAFIEMIENYLLLRGEQPSEKQIEVFEKKIEPNEVRYPPASPIRNKGDKGEVEAKLKEMFVHYLSDRARYPATKDVIIELNESFNCNLKYKDYRKRGRKDAITKCWSHISGLPKKQRMSLLNNFFRDDFPNSNLSHDEYLQLFRILTHDG
jgi:hypothetical protein